MKYTLLSKFRGLIFFVISKEMTVWRIEKRYHKERTTVTAKTSVSQSSWTWSVFLNKGYTPTHFHRSARHFMLLHNLQLSVSELYCCEHTCRIRLIRIEKSHNTCPYSLHHCLPLRETPCRFEQARRAGRGEPCNLPSSHQCGWCVSSCAKTKQKRDALYRDLHEAAWEQKAVLRKGARQRDNIVLM